jgi:tRNA A-37 threonylcarbamoyl transferase component Bud32
LEGAAHQIVHGTSHHDPLAPGRQVGKYEVVRRLASGGMAEIYLARARGIQGFEKFVVLKRILPQYAENETFVRMFLNEARVAATLDHPNIASVYDIDQQEGVYFFTMEYLHGEDLRLILKELGRRSQPLPLDHALTIAIGAAAGLHAAHEKRGPDGRPLGIVHRDVSPSNVVVTYDGGVKVVDFGIAKVTAQSEFTGTGSLKGKVAYMSPEQCRSQPLDRRSDIFAVGVILFELTTQTRLFKADTDVGTIQMVLQGDIPRPSSRVPDYPPALEAIVMKALERSPEARYQTARELQRALETFAQMTGLALSNAALGDWMERTFGPKPEAWRGLGLTGEFDAPLAAQLLATPPPVAVGEGSGTPRPPAPSGTDVPTRVTSMTKGGPLTLSALEGRRQLRTRLLVTVGVAAVALGFGGAALLRSLRDEPALAAATPTAVLVVPERGEVAVEPSPPPPPAPPTPVAVAPRPRAVRDPRPAAPRTPDFGKTFARRQRELERCFAASPEEAAAAGQLSVRFQVAPTGRVQAAEIVPAELARSALGVCVAKVASTTEFGPLPEPVAFSIPVSVRRLGGTKP